MNLQETFYLTTIIMEILAIILLLALVVLSIVAIKKFSELSENLNRKIDSVGQAMSNPANVATDVALSLGAGLVAGSINQVKRLLSRRGRPL
jgi:hypothetical protein